MVFDVHSAQRLSSEAVFVLCQSRITPTIQSYNEQKVIEMSNVAVFPHFNSSYALPTLLHAESFVIHPLETHIFKKKFLVNALWSINSAAAPVWLSDPVVLLGVCSF